jgi:UrcA family protein
VRQVVVRTGDLNLAREEGAHVLLDRLTSAANVACSAADSRDLTLRPIYRYCVNEALNRAVADTGSPLVASLYTGTELAVAENAYRPITPKYRAATRSASRHRHHRHYAQRKATRAG